MSYEVVNIPEVLFFQEGPGVRNHQYTNEGIKLLNVANLKDSTVFLDNSVRYISEDEAYGKYNHFLVDEGDLLIASSGIKVEYFEKKMGFVKKEHLPLCLNTSIIRFKTLDKNRLLIQYFYYFLKTRNFKKQISKLITGSAQLNFGPTHLAKIELPLPPLDIQKKIADTLDKAQELIDKRKEQISALDKFLENLFLDMFGDPVSNPMGWEVKKFSSIGKLERGKSKHRPRNAPELMGGSHPLIQTGDVANAGIYLKTYSQTYSDIGLAQSRMWNEGTLCITIAANIAKTAILTFQACFPDSVVGFLPDNSVSNTMYVQFWLMHLQETLEANAPESAQKNINLAILNDLNIPIPPLDLQNQFASIVEKVEAEKTKLEASLKGMEDNFNSIMQRAFKGELF